MRNDQQELSTFHKLIIDIVKNKNPSNVEELIKLIQLRRPQNEEEIVRYILYLQSQGKLVFNETHSPSFPPTLTRYIFSTQASWYWIIVALAIITIITVFKVPENAFPFIYARYLLGAIFVIWLPGYSLVKALFPKKSLNNLERVAFSIGMSLALVPIIGLFFNYTPWGIRVTPISLSLLTLTIIFATAAIIREHQTKVILDKEGRSISNGQILGKERDNARSQLDT